MSTGPMTEPEKITPEMAAAGAKALVENLKPWRRHLTIPHYNIPAIDIAKEVYRVMTEAAIKRPLNTKES